MNLNSMNELFFPQKWNHNISVSRILFCTLFMLRVISLAAEDYSTWSHSRVLLLNTTTSGASVSGDVYNFPVLIRLTASNFNFSEAESNGEDMRFTLVDGTYLPHERERWDSGSELAELWVHIPTVAGDAATRIIMYWGKNSAPDSSNGSAVFSADYGFVGVWHLNENVTDATGINNGSSVDCGTDDIAGMIGRARYFNAAETDSITIPHNTVYELTDSITFSVWTKQTLSDSWLAVISKSRAPDGGHADLWLGRGVSEIYVGLEGPLPTTNWTTSYLFPYNTFSYQTVVYDGSKVSLFVEGQLREQYVNSGTMQLGLYNTNDLAIGYSDAWGNHYGGIIDEVRIESYIRSADWVKLCYKNQKSSETLIENYIRWLGGYSSWATAANWSPAIVPIDVDSVLFNTGSNYCQLTADTAVGSITMTSGYSGNFDFNDHTLTINRFADFSMNGAGNIVLGGTSDKLVFNVSSGDTIIFIPPSGETMPDIEIDGGGCVRISTTALTGRTITVKNGSALDLGDDGLTHTITNLTATGGGYIDFGTAILHLSGNIDFSPFTGFITGSGTIQLTGAGTQIVTPKDASTTHPVIHHSGTGTFQIAGSKLKCESFINNNGIIDLNGQDLETVGDFTIRDGTNATIYVSGSSCLNGRTITVGGDALLEGGSCGGGNEMNCNATTTWLLTVSGSLTATNVNLDFCNASGSAGVAGNCVDGNNNTNWTFTSVKTWLGSTTSWNTASNWCPSGVPASTDTVYFNSTGTGPCVLDIDPSIAAIIFTGGFTYDFDFNNRKITATKKIDFRSGGTFTVIAGDWIAFNNISDAVFIPKSGTTLPQLEKSNTGLLTISKNGYTGIDQLYLINGSLDLGDDGVTHTVGLLTIDAGNLDFGNATLQTSNHVNLSNLATLTDGTGTLEFIGTSSQDFTPKSGQMHPSLIQNGSGGTVLKGTVTAGNLTISSGTFQLSGHSLTVNDVISTGGNINFNSTSSLRAAGDVDVSNLSTITDDGTGTLEFVGSSAQTFTPHATQVLPTIKQNGTGGTTCSGSIGNAGFLQIMQGTISLGSGYTHLVYGVTTGAPGGAIDFGSSTLQVKMGNADFSSLSSITPGTGTLDFMSGSCTNVLTTLTGSTLPFISHTGTGTLQLSGSTVQTQGFSQTAGTIDFNGIDFTTVSGGDFTISPVSSVANLGGMTITVAGDCRLNGQSDNVLNLNTTAASTWNINVTGSLTADYADIRNSNATGSEGVAAITCTNSGSNAKWSFAADWGITSSAFTGTSPSTEIRCMGGTSPNLDNLVVTKLNYRSNGSGTISIALYTGGSLSDPTGAVRRTEMHNVSVSAGWNEIDVSDRSWPKNTPTWIACANSSGARPYISTSSADCGDFQAAQGRWKVISPSDYDETTALPETITAGSFTGNWYAYYAEYYNSTKNNAPTDITLSASSLDENQAAGTFVCKLSAADSDPDSHVYFLVSGSGDSNNTSFTISNDTLYTNEVLDYEVQSSYGCRIQVDDCRGGLYDEAFTITVSNVNEGPVAGAGNALDFDGSDDYVNCGSPAELDITDVITIEAWVNSSSHASSNYVLTKRDDTNQQYGLVVMDGEVRFYTWGADSYMTTTETIALSEWTHIAAAFNSATQTGEIYINGIAKATDNTASAITTATSDVYIGARGDGAGGCSYPYHGLIDEVRVWHEVRSEADIQNNMYSALQGNETNLAGYWRMDKSSGTFLPDYSGSKSHGTLQNMTENDWVASEVWKNRSTGDETALTHSAGWDPDGDAVTLSQVVAPAQGSLSFNNGNRTVTYTPSLGQIGTFTYTYQISDGSITDTYDMSVEVVYDDPVVTSLDPADDKQSVAVDDNLIITFDEIVDVETGNIVIKRTSDDGVFETIDVAGIQVTGTGTNTITITPSSNFNAEGYYVQIDATAFDDVDGNSYAGIADKTTWNFSVVNSASWGITSSSMSSSYVTNDVRLMGNTGPATDNMVVSKINFRSGGNGTVAVGLYTGGALDNASGATYLTGAYNIPVTTGWNSIDVPNRTWPENTVTWLAFTVDGGAEAYGSTNSSDAGDFQTARGRYAVSSPSDYDETTQLPNTIGSGSFSNGWYTINCDYLIFSSNSAPTDISISPSSVAENQSAGTFIGIFTPTDVDPGSEHVYELIAGTGDSNNTSFTISNDSLFTNEVFDYEMQSSYGCRIKVDDCNGGLFEKAMTITVSNANEAPVAGAGNALAFDGNNEGVSLGSSEMISGTVWTLEFWIKLNGSADSERIFVQGANASSRRISAIYDAGADKIEFVTTTGTSSTPVTATTAITDAVWTHIAWTYNNGASSVYINGQSASSTTSGSTYGVTGDNFIARRTDGNYFTGTLDEMRLWNDVRSQTEIQNNIYSALTGGESNLVGYWRMDESSGTNLQDYSGNEYHGTLTNMENGDWIASEAWKDRSTNDDTPLTHNAGWDREGDGLTITQSVAPAQGSLAFNNDQKTVTYTPAVNSEGTFTYTYQVSDGSLTDTYAMSVAVTDVTVPAVSVYSPADDEDQVALGANFVLTFDENVQAGTGNITLYKSDDTEVEQMSIPGTQVSFNGADVTINPTDDLLTNTAYYIKIDNGAITDQSTGQNAYAGIADKTTWNFTTADITAPTVSTFSPADDATLVTAGSNLVVTFSEAVDAETGYISLYKAVGDVFVENFNVESEISGDGTTTITCDPADFESETDYYVLIDATAFDDASGNSFAGISDKTIWNFTTEDVAAPIVQTYSPADDAANVKVDADLSLTFDEDVQAGTGNITLYKSDDTRVEQMTVPGARVTFNGTTGVTINPTDNLNIREGYYILIDYGAIVDKSTNNNAFGGITDKTVWNFTAATQDTLSSTMRHMVLYSYTPGGDNSPKVGAFPRGSANGYSDETLLYFNVGYLSGTTIGMAKLEINITSVTDDGHDRTLRLFKQNKGAFSTSAVYDTYAESAWDTELDTLDNGSTGWFTFTSPALTGLVQDWINWAQNNEGFVLGGNFGHNTFCRVIGDARLIITTAPEVVSYNPADDAANVSVSSDLTLTFNENVQAGSGNITIYKSDHTQVAQIMVPDPQITFNGTTGVTINPTSDLPDNTSFYVQIDFGAITDKSPDNNPYPGIVDETTWTFTTEDNTSPVVQTLSPADNATAVAVGSDLVITFDEAVDAKTGNISLYKTAGDVFVEDFDVSAEISGSGTTTITCDPTDFEGDTEYYIIIDATAFDDLSGNSFAGISDKTIWNFTSADVVAPSISTLSPEDNGTDVAISSNLVITFDEAVDAETGYISLYKTAGDVLVKSFDVELEISGSGSATITCDPADFESETEYYVLIDATAFDDPSGNSFAGISDKTDWNFTSEDVIAPTVSSLSPTDNATDVAVSTSLVITFNENVQEGTGNITIYKEDDTQVEQIAINDARVTFDGTTGVTIDQSSNLADATGFYIQIDNGAITDQSSNTNAYGGINDETTWNFTTNSDPTDITLSVDNIDEEQAVGAVACTLATVDADDVDSYTYTLVAGSGDSNNTYFTISNDTLYTGKVFNYEVKTSYGVRIQTEDSYGSTFQKAFTIDINDINEKPTAGAGNALEFDGPSSGGGSDEYVDCGTDDIFNLSNGFTIECWINPDNTDWGMYVARSQGGPDKGYNFGHSGGNLVFITRGIKEYNTSVAITTGEWQHVAVVFNTGNDALFYLNGEYKQTVTGSSPVTTQSGLDLYIGQYSEEMGYFDGKIDEVRIWNDIRTENEIADNRYTALTGSEDNLIGYWRMDSTAGTHLKDYTVNGNHGTLINMEESDWVESEAWMNRTTNDRTAITHSAGWDPDAAGVTLSQVVAPAQGALSFNNANKTVTYTPTIDQPGTFTYTYKIDDGTYSDTYQMSVEVVSCVPIVESFTPADDTVDVSISNAFVITFDEIVDAETGNIYLYKADGDVLVRTFNVAGDISGSGTTTITINLSSNLEELTDYYIKIDATAFDDVEGYSYAGIADKTTWNFTTEDVTPPSVSTLSPADNATAVAIGSNLAINFTEAVDAQTGYIYLYKTVGDVLVKNFNVESEISGDGTATITCDPADFESETDYYVLIDATAFDDPSGNSFAGISDKAVWNFTSADVIAPSVSTLSPADNATAVAIGSNLVITFTEAVDAETGYISLYKTAGDVLVKSFNVQSEISGSGTTTITCDPADFESSTDYYVLIDATAFDDPSGNSFTGIFDKTIWNFTSEDVAEPLVSALTPLDNAKSVSVNSNLVITFNEAVDAETGYIYLYKTAGDVLVEDFDVESEIGGSGTTTITCNPLTDFESLTDYYILIDATAFDDPSGNSFAGISDKTVWNFTAADADDPIVSSLSPTDDAVGVAVNANLVITFNEPVNAVSGNITIYKTVGDVFVESFDVTADISGDGTTTITCDPADFESETDYYVQIDATVFDDLIGNSYAGITDKVSWNFTSADIIEPDISTLSPADNATAVAVGSNLVITFTEAVDAETGYISLYKTVGDVFVRNFNVQSEISGDGTTTITCDPADFESSTDYYVLIDATAFDDPSGNSFDGISDKTIWNFTSEDVAAPTISTLSPSDNALGVAVGSNLVITFNEPVDDESGNIALYKTNGDVLVQFFNVKTDITGSGTATITCDPTDDLDNETGYYILIDATAFDDPSGNSFAGISDKTAWNFKTEDNTAPVAQTFNPADNAVDVSVTNNLVITFSENVKPGTGKITLYRADDNQIEQFNVTDTRVTFNGTTGVTIDPTGELAEKTGYYILIDNGAITDQSANANAYAGITDKTLWNFTTEDNTGPSIVSMTPADNAVNIAVNTSMTLTFDENVQEGTGNITLYRSDNTLIEQMAVTGTRVTFNGTTGITIDPADNLAEKTVYYIKIDSAAIVDQSSNQNAFAGIKNAATWNFTTVDNFAPVVTLFIPSDDAVAVAVDTDLKIIFDENVVVNTGNISIKRSIDDGDFEVMALPNVKVAGTGTDTIIINPAGIFSGETAYYVLIDNTCFEDASGNSYAGIADKTVWNFTTADITPPSFAATYPKLDTVGGTTAEFLAQIDEHGKAYFVVVPAGSTAPTSAQVKAGLDASGTPVGAGMADTLSLLANTESSFSAQNLTSETAYDAYIVAEDITANLQAAPVKLSFTTPDVTAPTVTSITSNTADGLYSAGDTIDITITFSEAVTLTGGNLLLTLETGENDYAVTITTLTNTISANGMYIVQADDSTGDLNVTAISLTTGAVLKDGSNNDADLTLPVNNLADTKNIAVDGIIPVITGISSTTPDGLYKIGDTITVLLSFSESVTNQGGNCVITLETGTTDAILTCSVMNSATTVSVPYIVQSGHETGDLSANTVTLSAGTLTDAAGNNADISIPTGNNIADLKAIAVDGVRPVNVTALTGSALSGTAIALLWSASPSTDVKNVAVRYRTDGAYPVDQNDGTLWKTLTAGVVTDTMNDLTEDTDYAIALFVADSAGNWSDAVDTAHITIRTKAVSVASLQITPDSITLSSDSTQQFAVTAYNKYNEVVPADTVYWECTGGIGTISTAGLFDATTAGAGRIIAVCQDIRDTTKQVTVVPGALAAITVSPDTGTVRADTTVQFTAVGNDADGNSVTVTDITWSINKRSGSIDSTGLFTPGYIDTVHISAVCADIFDTTGRFVIVPGALASLAITPDSSTTILSGQTLQFSVSGTDCKGNSTGTGTIIYGLTNQSVGRIDTAGLFAPQQNGMTRIYARSQEYVLSDTTDVITVCGNMIMPNEFDTIIITENGVTLMFLPGAIDSPVVVSITKTNLRKRSLQDGLDIYSSCYGIAPENVTFSNDVIALVPFDSTLTTIEQAQKAKLFCRTMQNPVWDIVYGSAYEVARGKVVGTVRTFGSFVVGVDTQLPVVNHYALQQVDEGSTIRLSIDVFDNIYTNRLTVRYKVGGADSFLDTLILVTNSGEETRSLLHGTLYGIKQATTNTTAVIHAKSGKNQYTGAPASLYPMAGTINIDFPTAMATASGFEYTIQSDDGSNLVTTENTSIAVATQNISAQEPVPSMQWHLISVPMQQRDNTLNTLFTPLGKYDPTQWKVYSWESGSYVETMKGVIDTITKGKSYWLKTRKKDFILRTGEAVSIRTDTPYSITLKPGWNLISNPFAFDISWNALRELLDSMGVSDYVTGPYTYDGTSWRVPWPIGNIVSIKTWHGYAVKNETAKEITFPIPASAYSEVRARRGMVLPAKGFWTMPVMAINRGDTVANRVIGIHPTAADRQDKMDYIHPPDIESRFNFTMNRKWDSEKTISYITDIRAPYENGQTWEMSVKDAAGKLTLVFDITASGLHDDEIYLFDMLTCAARNLRRDSAYTYDANMKLKRDFAVIVGTYEYVQNKIAELTFPRFYNLGHNFPNPFNHITHIRYQIPVDGRVTLRVYNLLGRRIINLVNGYQKAGFYTVTWNGRDRQGFGREMASGLYIYQLVVRDKTASKKLYSKTRKMKLVR